MHNGLKSNPICIWCGDRADGCTACRLDMQQHWDRVLRAWCTGVCVHECIEDGHCTVCGGNL